MPITNHYHEALSFGENLVTFIIHQLQEREQYKILTATLKEEGYPEAGNFKIPAEGEQAVRITFAEAKKMLKESGYDIGEDEMADIEYVPLLHHPPNHHHHQTPAPLPFHHPFQSLQEN